MARRGFNFRSFTSFILVWTFLTLVVSGAILYVAPPGRISNWTRWQLLLLTKEQWQAVHTLTAIVFLVGGLLHSLKYNWKSLMTYLRRRTEGRQPVRYEVLASLALFLLILFGTIAQQVPFQTVMTAGAAVRESWEAPSGNPPIPHMEEMSLTDVAKNIQVEPEKLVQSLDKLGYRPAGQDDRLRDVAKRNSVSPERIYSALKAGTGNDAKPLTEHKPAATAGGGGGRGQGFKTLAELARENNLTVETAVQKLAAAGIEAKAEDRMRDIAGRSGKKPYEVIKILKAEPKK